MTTTLFVMLNTMSAQAGITERTWLVTCLGFTIVLVLLLLFVFVMKGLGWLMQPRQKAVVAEPAKQETAATIPANDLENDMAAIAMALHSFYGLHDIDSVHLTIHSHHTMWNHNL